MTKLAERGWLVHVVADCAVARRLQQQRGADEHDVSDDPDHDGAGATTHSD
jgi:hypothetical protein